MARRAHHRGFSLIELMVALVITAIVTVQVLALFASQQRVSVSQRRVVDTQEDARLVADMVLSDLRMSGFMVPRLAGVSSIDGGAGAADVACASDPSVIADASLTDAMVRFAGASPTTALGAGDDTVSLPIGDLDIDGNGTDDFIVGRGIIVSDGSDTHCGRILSVNAGNVQFAPATPAGFAAAPLTTRAAPAVIYQLTAAGLTRNGLLLSTDVEDLQLEFGVDVNDDGQLAGGEFPIHDLNGTDTANIRRIRVTVITRTAAQNPRLGGPGRQAAANRNAAGAADNFQRRLATVTAAPRNLL